MSAHRGVDPAPGREVSPLVPLGVGLGVGVPMLLAALVGLWLGVHRWPEVWAETTYRLWPWQLFLFGLAFGMPLVLFPFLMVDPDGGDSPLRQRLRRFVMPTALTFAAAGVGLMAFHWYEPRLAVWLAPVLAALVLGTWLWNGRSER